MQDIFIGYIYLLDLLDIFSNRHKHVFIGDKRVNACIDCKFAYYNDTDVVQSWSCSYKVMWTWTDVSCAVFTPTAEAMISDMTIISKHCWLNPAPHSIFHEQRCHLPNIQSRGRW